MALVVNGRYLVEFDLGPYTSICTSHLQILPILSRNKFADNGTGVANSSSSWPRGSFLSRYCPILVCHPLGVRGKSYRQGNGIPLRSSGGAWQWARDGSLWRNCNSFASSNTNAICLRCWCEWSRKRFNAIYPSAGVLSSKEIIADNTSFWNIADCETKGLGA